MNGKKRILHILGGTPTRGGVFSVIRGIVGVGMPGYSHAVWVKRGFPVDDYGDVEFCANGVARGLNGNIIGDLWSALLESRALSGELRSGDGACVLHAHTRGGILASILVSRRIHVPVVMHLHTLGRWRCLYRWLAGMKRVVPLANSRKTLRHYGLGEGTRVCVPFIDWPEGPAEQAYKDRSAPCKFVSANEIIPLKKIDRMLDAWDSWVAQGGEGRLLLYGFADVPVDRAYSDAMLARASEARGVTAESWTESWYRDSGAQVYLHLSDSESFGLSLLHAFAAGMKIVVCRGTFLDELQAPIAEAGIYRVEDDSRDSVVSAMRDATNDSVSCKDLWDIRKEMAEEFSSGHAAGILGGLYGSFESASAGVEKGQ